MPKTSEAARPCLLITGASGFLGHPLTMLARQRWRVVAVYRSNRPQVDGVTCIQADLTDASQLEALLRRFQPRAVIHTAAAARIGDCEADPEATALINVTVPERLAEGCAQLAIDFLFTSTDLVFDGQQAPYDETAVPNPLGAYAAQKAAAEGAVLQRHPGALVCRMPLLFGLAPHAANHFTVQMLAAMAAGQPLNLFVDEFRTPVDNTSAARGLLAVLGRARGLLHLGGARRVSRYELGVMMCRAMGIEPTMIRPVHIHEVNLSVPRAPDCSLVSSRALGLGYAPTPLQTAVKATVDAFVQDRSKAADC